MSERKSSELHFTAVNWLTGIASAAAGAGLLLLIEHKADGYTAWGLSIMVVLLLLGFAFGTLVQLHAIAAVGFDEVGNAQEAEKSRGHRRLFQKLMLASLYLAVFLICVGALIAAFSGKSVRALDTSAPWTVVAASSDESTENIVVSDSKTVIVLTRKSGDSDWTSASYSRSDAVSDVTAPVPPAANPLRSSASQ